ncbi:MAG: Smr/MutS family protein [Candidatus Pelagibacter sp.]
MNSKISDKDKKDWDNFLSNNENLPDKDISLHEKKIKKILTFDLHGHSLDDANQRVKELIFDSYHNKISKLIIVTGKGLHSQNEKDPYVSKDLGILKHSVPEYIKSNKELMKMINIIKDADIKDGGSGAFYIYLKKKL